MPDAAASHFLVLARSEQMLSMLNMFFLVHLLTKGRTTKKERSTRSLYCFDFGICEENNLGFTTDKNVIRQQRFAYDDALARFEKYFGVTAEATFRCPECGTVYTESELVVAGMQLTFCPRDKADLVSQIGAAWHAVHRRRNENHWHDPVSQSTRITYLLGKSQTMWVATSKKSPSSAKSLTEVALQNGSRTRMRANCSTTAEARTNAGAVDQIHGATSPRTC